MTRPNDINLDQEQIPKGQFLVEGKFLANSAKKSKIPYGSVSKSKPLPGGQRYTAPVGLVFFDEDKERVDAMLAARDASKNLRLTYPSYVRRNIK